jgi:hypothetical protein
MVKGQRTWGATSAVDDCRNFTFVTQAAARTFPLVFAVFRNQIEFFSHD